MSDGRRRRFALVAAMALMEVLLLCSPVSASTDPITVSGGFTTTDAGSFGVQVAARPETGSCSAPSPGMPAFGDFQVNADGGANGQAPAPINLCLSYSDMQVNRPSFTVQVKIDTFHLKANPMPTFEGADQVDFQIPNRYLTLNTVGAIQSVEASGTGMPMEAITGSAGDTLDHGPFTIAKAGGESGSGTWTQELNLTLNIPAGVYPGEYDAMITIETVAGS